MNEKIKSAKGFIYLFLFIYLFIYLFLKNELFSFAIFILMF